MGVRKGSRRTNKSSRSGKVAGAVRSAIGLGKGKSGKSRKHGPTWYANKILIEKMKKKLNKLKYGGMR